MSNNFFWLRHPDLLAALLEKLVVAQGRYQKKGTTTTIYCARMNGDVRALVDYTLDKAKNDDLVTKDGSYFCCNLVIIQVSNAMI